MKPKGIVISLSIQIFGGMIQPSICRHTMGKQTKEEGLVNASTDIAFKNQAARKVSYLFEVVQVISPSLMLFYFMFCRDTWY